MIKLTQYYIISKSLDTNIVSIACQYDAQATII